VVVYCCFFVQAVNRQDYFGIQSISIFCWSLKKVLEVLQSVKLFFATLPGKERLIACLPGKGSEKPILKVYEQHLLTAEVAYVVNNSRGSVLSVTLKKILNTKGHH